MKLCKKQKLLASRLQRSAAARNDVISKKIASGLFENLSGRPEDWTVSGPCHLYSKTHSTLGLCVVRSALQKWVITRLPIRIR